MFAYEKTFDRKVFLCHCDLILWFSDFLHMQIVGFSMKWFICDSSFPFNLQVYFSIEIKILPVKYAEFPVHK